MPVEDHALHPSTIQKSGYVYGCHNKPRRRDPLSVKDGHSSSSVFGIGTVQKWRKVPDFGSLECRYDKSLTDQSCKGCQHAGSGEAYAKQVQENGK